ncbi:MAE_28990/MAE_18760 family HEPN-like nuclease [Serratia marcescens]|uniref:MAE_28990/MAE_18760 family HEPN-like nuclease n=5 Tax=Serratia marcescens TaxID=615 RepID=UPI0011AB5221|nr:MAE_28990/MAE_18760 family HEPN-like nuclease [Serratia marcescens]MDP8616450.1 MAE_28990/MAE_18760 family HEPN-like nuclease [Serratia marcescens]MDP8646577.1 MAE_28990/MAE_18760 family HEPN-like nuclease [Serratia marcescens]MDP8656503.1 MAE_28990/MAE_18760 family HEPN-like nuclease [Serratia marcescens]MDP8661487.1 MAE_28990/MAE_18760 family HEPN-like nuclease [Serratia marcescens]MDP8720727.1 MAE_28990/MAE_18760 family HEPN-like nuclease [Serratia marcescens]
MDTAYLQFEQGYKNLVQQIEYLEGGERMLHEISHAASSLRSEDITFSKDFSTSYTTLSLRTQRSKFAYNLVIISLYGLLEQFIEGQIECFVRVISARVKKYEELPEKLKSSHPILTLKYAQKNLDDRYKDPNDKLINHSILIKSLYDSLDCNSERFTVNGKAFSSHSSNFRYDLINNMFQDIGVDRVIERTLSIVSVGDFYKKFFGLDDTISHSNLTSKISEELLDLVQRRNRIAHGVIEDDILSYALLKEKINFINVLSKAISQVCTMVEQFHIYRNGLKNKSIYNFMKPSNTFEKANSFGFVVKDLPDDLIGKLVYIGQRVYLERNDTVSSYEIESLVINRVEDCIFETTDSFEFAIRLKGVSDVKKYSGHVFSFSNA